MSRADRTTRPVTTFEQKRLTFAAKRLGLRTPADLEAWLTRPEKPLPPDEVQRRRADFQEAIPALRPEPLDI